MAPLPN